MFFEALEKMPEQFTDETAILHSNIAISLMKIQKYEEAEEQCTRAIDLKPDFVKARANRAECFYQLKKFEKSLEGLLIRL